MPLGLELTDEGLWRWLSTRAIPQNRRFATELCRSLGLSTNDRSGILAVSKALSLNDSYWIAPANSEDAFAACNLFDNGFSSVLAAVAYTGCGERSARAHAGHPRVDHQWELAQGVAHRGGRRAPPVQGQLR